MRLPLFVVCLSCCSTRAAVADIREQQGGLCWRFVPINDAGWMRDGPLFSSFFDLMRLLLDDRLPNKKVGHLKGLALVIFNDVEVYKGMCPAVVAMAYLFQAEAMVLAVLPLASNETPESLLGPILLEATGLAAFALSLARSEPFDAAASAVLERLIVHTGHIFDALHHARSEPWTGTLRAWPRDPSLWRSFNQLARITLVPIPPTHWDFESLFGPVRKQLSGISAEENTAGWSEVSQALAALLGTAVEWWPLGGTLIGLLRYGRVYGHLSDGKLDLVDDDIDFLVVLSSARQWLEFCVRLAQALVQRGWLGCGHILQKRYTNRTHDHARLGQDMRGLPLLLCARLRDAGHVVLNIYWARPVTPVRGGAGLPACSRSLPPPACGRSVALMPHEGGESAISEEVHCQPDGSCFSMSTFFKAWPSAALPFSYRRPLARCRAFGGEVGCPRLAEELLRRWCGGEYWRPSTARAGGVLTWPCLGLPDVACPDPGKGVKASWRTDRVPTFRHNLRLQAEGLTLADARILRSTSQRLRAAGFLAHNFSGCDWSRCVRRAG